MKTKPAPRKPSTPATRRSRSDRPGRARKGAVRPSRARPGPSRPGSSRPGPSRPERAGTLQWLLILALVTLPALTIADGAKESFRLPKLFVCETLGLLTLLFLIWRLRAREPRALLRHPAVVATLPLVLVATGGLVTSDHPLHVRQALASLWIGAGCLVGWSWTLTRSEHRRVLTALLLPATALAAIAVAQFHGYEPFSFEGYVKDRIAVTSLAGGAFDLAAYLVLPMLVAQTGLRRPGRRWPWVLFLVLGLYAVAVSQTLTAIVALVVASLMFWLLVLPWRRVAAVAAVLAVVGSGLAIGVTPLRVRIAKKVESLKSGDLNQVLTGRLDGWWAALWMFRQHPLLGVGHGAYRAEFGDARLVLHEEGRRFYRRQHQTYFGNAHNEILEAAAEWGIVGCLAVAWALWRLGLRLRQRRRALAGAPASGIPVAGSPAERGPPAAIGIDLAGRIELALMGSGLIALGILTLSNFPLRIALVAYPYLLFLSWIFAGREGSESDGSVVPSRAGSVVPSRAGSPAPRSPGRSPGRLLAWLLLALVAAGLDFELRRAERRLRASHQLAEVEETTLEMGRQGLLARRPLDPGARRILERHIAMMNRAAELDPVEVGIPIARGSQHLLLGRHQAAIRAYEEALVLEARAETFANLGRSYYLSGDREAARAAFETALRLNRNIARRYRAYVREFGLGAGLPATGEPADGGG